MNAQLKDLLLENWLRNRNNGLITWTTKDNKTIPIKDLSAQHLKNIINILTTDENFSDLIVDSDSIY